jgi:hypothetical protein
VLLLIFKHGVSWLLAGCITDESAVDCGQGAGGRSTSLSMCVTKRRNGETKEGEGNEAGNREAHVGNRAGPATQVNAEHSEGSKSHTGAQTILNSSVSTTVCNLNLHFCRETLMHANSSRKACQKVDIDISGRYHIVSDYRPISI